MSGSLLLALIPLVVLSLVWVGWLWYDISKRDVQHLPKWAWALIVVMSVPIGGILYLLVGRNPR